MSPSRKLGDHIHVGPALKALLSTRKPGRCFCGRARTERNHNPGKAATCGRKPCLDRWRRAYMEDWRRPVGRGNAMRDIKTLREHLMYPGKIIVTLSCGHEETMFVSRLRPKQKRMTCVVCTEALNEIVAAAVASLEAGR